ncbi:hypothetical protein BCR44DRAFT_1443818 [Catenaria anguillulae PL171]|uniref:UBX domain-containing protein n=1 Tax=Catenaria anguillulae PL171 TaxID=765915 RepID=A0A1Y2HA25_9FUNG|nr:hypothetical protein BCR44DRAFT_1443818 [Catenaria anguillulae PL171]
MKNHCNTARIARPIRSPTANARPGTPQDRPLDLSLSVRLANLSAGAKLELTRRTRPANSAGPIKIALQLDSGGRIIDTPPKGGIKVDSGQLSAKLGDPEYMVPVLIVANREIGSLNELRNSTLASLGIPAGGSVLIRLVFKYSGRKLADVLPEIEAPLPPVEGLVQAAAPAPTALAAPAALPTAPTASPSATLPVATAPTAPAASPAPERTRTQSVTEDRMDVDPTAQTSVPSAAGPPPAATQVLEQHQPTEAEIEHHPDPVPVLSAQERRRRELENMPLKTQAMRDREERQRRAKFPRTLIRVKLPDEYLLQLTFYTHEKVSALYSTLASLLITTPPPLSFRLVTTAPRMKDLDPTDDFWTAQLAPASVVRLIPLVHDDKVGPVVPLPEAGDGQAHNLLLESPGAQETDEEKRERLAKASRDMAARVLGGRTVGGASGLGSSSSLDGSASSSSGGGDSEKKTPKWFRAIKSK